MKVSVITKEKMYNETSQEKTWNVFKGLKTGELNNVAKYIPMKLL